MSYLPTTARDWSADAMNQEVGADSWKLKKDDNNARILDGCCRSSAQICILIIHYLP